MPDETQNEIPPAEALERLMNGDTHPLETFVENYQIRNNVIHQWSGGRAAGRNAATMSQMRIPAPGLHRPQAPKPNPFTQEELVQLEDMASKLHSAWHDATHGEDRPRERRDQEYQQVRQNEKTSSMSAVEMVYSEIPIPLDFLSSRIFKEIVNERMCRGLQKNDDGNTDVFCANCHRTGPKWLMFLCSGAAYCAIHAPTLEACAICGDLGTGHRVVTTFDEHTIYVCDECANGHRGHCHACQGRIAPEFLETGYCEACVRHDGAADSMRRFSYALTWVGEELGKIVRSKRMFSAEVEAVSPSSAHLTKMARMIPTQCGLSGDGSITPDKSSEQGFEVQTPRLGGSRGEELVQRMATAFKETSAYVNKSCGLHIHLDGKDIILASRRERPVALFQLWKAHLVFEDVILGFLPYERRRNTYCRPMRDSFSVRDVETCSTLLDAEKLWYKERTYDRLKSCKGHHYHSSRYFGVNFHSLLANRHLEIRYHSGTMNAKKILEWANLHALIMDTAAKKKFTYDFLEEAQATTNIREKTKMLFEKIGLAESSQHYFFARQRKFDDKGANDADMTSN